jgi:hypothetical protein
MNGKFEIEQHYGATDALAALNKYYLEYEGTYKVEAYIR